MALVAMLVCLTACKGEDRLKSDDIIDSKEFIDNSADLYYCSLKDRIEIHSNVDIEHIRDHVELGDDKVFISEVFYDEGRDEWPRKFEIYSLKDKKVIKSETYVNDEACRLEAYSICGTDRFFIDIRPKMERRGIELYSEHN